MTFLAESYESHCRIYSKIPTLNGILVFLWETLEMDRSPMIKDNWWLMNLLTRWGLTSLSPPCGLYPDAHATFMVWRGLYLPTNQDPSHGCHYISHVALKRMLKWNHDVWIQGFSDLTWRFTKYEIHRTNQTYSSEMSFKLQTSRTVTLQSSEPRIPPIHTVFILLTNCKTWMQIRLKFMPYKRLLAR